MEDAEVLKQECRRKGLHCQDGPFPIETAYPGSNDVVLWQVSFAAGSWSRKKPNGSVETFVEPLPLL